MRSKNPSPWYNTSFRRIGFFFSLRFCLRSNNTVKGDVVG
jgi:hypothetical protein